MRITSKPSPCVGSGTFSPGLIACVCGCARVFACVRMRLSDCMCTVWCSEIDSLTSLGACNSGASSDVREPISLYQTVCVLGDCL